MIDAYSFNSQIFILPGLGNSGDQHWQTHWQNKFNFSRIDQKNWETPICNEWIDVIEQHLDSLDHNNIILVGHSLACAAIAFWCDKYQKKIKGVLLVAPCDTEALSYPEGTVGFKPMPLNKLPFPSIVICSSNDFYVTSERANFFANAWGSKLINIGEAGHINPASGFGEWFDGLQYLKELDSVA